MKSHKSTKTVTTASRSVRDTKYYRYLEGYYQNDPEIIQIMKWVLLPKCDEMHHQLALEHSNEELCIECFGL